MKSKLLKLSLILVTSLGFYNQASAQVKGVGYTLAPLGERVWWDKNSGLKDGYMAGGQFGFSFGEFVELRGLYLTALNQKRDFTSFGLDADKLADLDVKIERWGGDLKLNLGRGALLPYLTVGTGVQNTKLGDQEKNQQIYFSGGLGIMLSVADRYTLGLQAIRTSYRDSPVNTLLTADERALLPLPLSEYTERSLNNWSARASLLFYLGGRSPSQLSDIDKAYMDTFSSGLKGISLPIEPIIGKFSWSDNLPYKSTTFGGVATGLDFGPLVGVRAYYLRSFEDKLFQDFDKLEIWGGEGKFKLASTGGLIPFLTVGGGKINVLEGYENPDLKSDTTSIEGRSFASGGGGFDIVLSRHIKLSAFARAMLTSSNKSVIEDVSDPNKLSTSWLYGASLNFIIGKKPGVPQPSLKAENYDNQVKANLDKEKRNTRALRSQYQQKLDKLEEDMEEAYKNGDSDAMAKKYEEKESLKAMILKLDDVLKREEDANKDAGKSADGYQPQMNPSELRSLVDEIKKSQKQNEQILQQTIEVQNLKHELQLEKMNLRLQAMEEMLRNAKTNDAQQLNSQSKSLEKDYYDLKQELNELRKKSSQSNVKSEADSEKTTAAKSRLMNTNDETDEEDDLEEEIEETKKEIKETKSQQKVSSQDEVSAKKKEDSAASDKKQAVDKKETQERKETIDKKQAKTAAAASLVEEEKKELAKKEKEAKKAEAKEEREAKRKAKKEDAKEEDVKSKKESKAVKSEQEEQELEIDEDTLENPADSLTVKDSTTLEPKFVGNRSYRVGGYSYLSEEQLEHKGAYNSDSGFFSRMYYEGASAIVGLSLGGDATFNIGLRQHYRFNQSNFFFMPETFFGFGNPASFGLFANGVYQFKVGESSPIEPYAGLGVGIMQVGQGGDHKIKGAFNIVFGTNLFKVGDGRFFADWSARNFFKYNQLALGYRLPF